MICWPAWDRTNKNLHFVGVVLISKFPPLFLLFLFVSANNSCATVFSQKKWGHGINSYLPEGIFNGLNSLKKPLVDNNQFSESEKKRIGQEIQSKVTVYGLK